MTISSEFSFTFTREQLRELLAQAISDARRSSEIDHDDLAEIAIDNMLSRSSQGE